MKKLLLSLAVIILSISTAKAQEIRLGAKAGVNFARFSGKDLENVESITGFHIGFLVEIALTEKFALQPEGLYSIQGSKFDESNGIFLRKAEIKLNYMQVPIMGKFYVLDGLSIEAGPQVAVLTSSKGMYLVKSDDNTSSYNKDTNDISSIEVSLLAGVSYRLPLGVFFGMRYNYGINNINATPGYQNTHNNVIQISGGYFF